jgi:hypothetical protein
LFESVESALSLPPALSALPTLRSCPVRTRHYALVVLFLFISARAMGADIPGLKFSPIDFPAARTTEARGINNLGQVVGSWEDPDTRSAHGFVLGAGVYTSIDVPGALHTVAYDINDNGDIVGTFEVTGADGTIQVHGFLLVSGQFTTITVPGAAVTQATGINNRGQIVGSYIDIDDGHVVGVHGFLLSDGAFTTIDYPVAGSAPPVTYALDIDDNGAIVGGYNDNDVFQSRRGYVLEEGIFRAFDVPGSLMTDVFGVNNTGGMVGIYQDGRDGQFYSFLFTAQRGFSRVSSKGSPKRARTLTAFAVNDAISIAGATYDGTVRGFLATVPPRR